MKNKKTKLNPVNTLAKIQRAKMGTAEGSMLEGGKIKFGRTPKELKARAKELKEKVVPVLIDEGRLKKADRKTFKANKLLTRADKLESKAVKKKFKKSV